MTTADDLVHIRALYDRYSHGIDTGDGEMFAGCFTEDGSLDTGGGPMVGHDAIAAFGTETHAGLPALRHQANNIVVDVDGDTATAAAFMSAYLVEPAFSVIVTGRYADEFRRTADGWRISSRVFTADATG
ncbi:MAG: nuclear transport factor 2 family protein [Acidimicrobiales bacterium]|nr:nuclear transport factor 2 family protein [Acidimicrobiales bacterium]